MPNSKKMKIQTGLLSFVAFEQCCGFKQQYLYKDTGDLSHFKGNTADL
jgi:hypothetical protein